MTNHKYNTRKKRKTTYNSKKESSSDDESSYSESSESDEEIIEKRKSKKQKKDSKEGQIITINLDELFNKINKKSKYNDEYYDDEYNDEYYDEYNDEYSEEEDIFPIEGNKELQNKINKSSLSKDMKIKLIKKLKSSCLDSKQMEWFETVLSIPFNKYSKFPVNIKSDKSKIEKFFSTVIEKLDEVIYGMESVKEEIVNYIAQCLTLNGKTCASPRILALEGSPGTGKTQIIREGISKCLGIPMQSFSMGGIKDSSYFVGFDFTYQGSRQGSLVQSLITSKVMNPILFFDELDKISGTNEGQEIENLLIHLTDPVQNHEFKDKYLSLDFNIDLSKVMFIFAFNDINNISPVLRDRLNIIKIKEPTINEKLIIVKKHIIPELLKNIGINKDEFEIKDKVIENIIINEKENNENNSSGLRGIKRTIETILLKINTIKVLKDTNINLSFMKKNESDIKFPIVVDETNIDKFIKKTNSKNVCKYPHMYI
jgi:ATP-dependent Lon protease